MNLLDNYVAEVGKHLPRSQRADIEKELKSTLGNLIPMLVLTIIIIVSTVEVGQMVYRLLSARPSSR